jgi:nitrogen-specific signal transduction histidine kinase/putative methionine-R-sulfoxide reductase with GAF domain
MNFSDKKYLVNALVLSAAVVLLFLSFWEMTMLWVVFVKNSVAPGTFTLYWHHFFLLLGVGIFFGWLTEKFGAKKVLPAAIGFICIWGIINFVAAAYFSVNLFFLRTVFVVLAPILAVHLKKLWEIDSELTEKLVSLASAGHLIEGKPAELRIESGLKLLETVLPLSEAIVFYFDEDGNLKPVGRARNGAKVLGETTSARQIAWRESVSLCEEAVKWRETMVQEDDDQAHSAQIAVPLLQENEAVGVLYVKVAQDFESADQHLLEAFSGQLARNFQRRDLRRKSLPNKFWWSFLSTKSAENRVDIIKLINGNIKEQSFSVLANSYLKEAHAIAYLDGTLAFLNRQMRHLARLEPHDIFDLDLFGLLEKFKTEIFNEPRLALRRVLQTGEVYKNELYFPNSGKTLKIQITLVKVPSDEESIHDTNVPMKPACFLVTLRNITAVKENERLRSDMASLMSHELRTPITSIQGFAELLLMDEEISGENREFLTIIAGESQRLSKMLTTFLSVSKLEQSDKQEFHKTPVKLDSVVSEVVGDFHETARQKRIRLVEHAANHLPPVAADKSLISRAIAHLVDNAIKYSPERTSVIISTILETDFLRVVVEDRGYGIPKSEHEKIWQKFYRVAREGQDKQEESTGLGLPLVKEIIEQHGGEVEVESEVGFGSKFSLKLPRL